MKKRTLTLKIGLVLIGVWVMSIAAPMDLSFCLPQKDEVVSGTAEFIFQDHDTLQINASNKAIINYDSFSIMQNESVIINLPTIDSTALHRVIGDDNSLLLGSLTCNGTFILINKNGIYFGPSAQMNVGSLISSTRDIDNENFLNFNYVFERMSEEKLSALILNRGAINIRSGGFGVLIAGAVENQGAIVARLGTIALASGDMVKLTLSDDGMISIAIEKKVASQILDVGGSPITTQLKNTGTLDADGGVVLLSAKSLPHLFEKAVNLGGQVRANRVEKRDGVVRIVAANNVRIDADIEATKVEISDPQTLVATNVQLDGGRLYAESGITIFANKYIITAADLRCEDADIRLCADYDGEGVGEFHQLAGLIEAAGRGSVYIEGSGPMTLDTIAVEYGTINIGAEKAPDRILGEPRFIHTRGDLDIKLLSREGEVLMAETPRGDVLRYSPQVGATLQASAGVVRNLTAPSVETTLPVSLLESEPVTTMIFKNYGDFSIGPAPLLAADSDIDIDMLYRSMALPNTRPMDTSGINSDSITTPVPAIISAPLQLQTIERRIGTLPVRQAINSNIAHIQRTDGGIGISESTGLGTSIIARGPPECDFGQNISPENDSPILNSSRRSVPGRDFFAYFTSRIPYSYNFIHIYNINHYLNANLGAQLCMVRG